MLPLSFERDLGRTPKPTATDMLSIHPAMLLPAGEVGNALSTVPDGTYSYIGFYDAFLRPVIDAGIAADIAVYTPQLLSLYLAPGEVL